FVHRRTLALRGRFLSLAPTISIRANGCQRRGTLMRFSNLTRTTIAFRLLILPAVYLGVPGSPPARNRAPYQDPTVPIAKRVADLVSRMTLEEKVLQMQHTAPAIPRLGIPSYDWWNEALHGVARSGYATVFPQAIAMA